MKGKYARQKKDKFLKKLDVSKRRSEISMKTERFGTIEEQLEEPEEVISSSWTQALEHGWSRQEILAKY
jgi:hypothetical protein